MANIINDFDFWPYYDSSSITGGYDSSSLPLWINSQTTSASIYKCITCGKVMGSIWETVCFKCHEFSCYKHSIEKDGYWYCLKCAREISELKSIQEIIKSRPPRKINWK